MEILERKSTMVAVMEVMMMGMMMTTSMILMTAMREMRADFSGGGKSLKRLKLISSETYLWIFVD